MALERREVLRNRSPIANRSGRNHHLSASEVRDRSPRIGRNDSSTSDEMVHKGRRWPNCARESVSRPTLFGETRSP